MKKRKPDEKKNKEKRTSKPRKKKRKADEKKDKEEAPTREGRKEGMEVKAGKGKITEGMKEGREQTGKVEIEGRTGAESPEEHTCVRTSPAGGQ